MPMYSSCCRLHPKHGCVRGWRAAYTQPNGSQLYACSHEELKTRDCIFILSLLHTHAVLPCAFNGFALLTTG